MIMQTPSRSIRFLIATMLFVAAHIVSAQSTMSIDVPNRDDIDPASNPIFEVQAIIDVNNDSPITFDITDPNSDTVTIVIPTTGTNPFVPIGSLYDFVDFPVDGGRQDSVTISKVEASEFPGRYEISLTLSTNSDNSMGGCAEETGSPTEQFTITVPATSGQMIEGVCLRSFENDAACGGAATTFIDPFTDPGHATATGSGATPTPDPACFLDRRPIDVALVLDKSGSMRSMMPPSGGPTKIEALRRAVDEFMDRWVSIRQFEVSGGGSAPLDRVVVVPFSSDVDCSMFADIFCNDSGLSDVPLLNSLGAPGGDVISASIKSTVNATPSVLNAGGATSIGDGLDAAAIAMTPLPADGVRRKVILVMSDGRENTLLRVRLADGGSSSGPIDWDHPSWDLDNVDESIDVQLGFGDDDADWDDLVNEDLLSIYSVTLGSATTIKPAVNHGISRATGGFYVNSETDDASILSIFFIELLQNFVRFNTWETVHIASARFQPGPAGGQPRFGLPFPLGSTSQAVSLDAAWDATAGNICVDITAPGVSDSFDVCGQNGRLRWDSSLPLPPPYDVASEWQAVFRPAGGSDATTGTFNAPFYFIITADDSRINSEFGVLPGNYVASDPIPVQVRMTESGRPITGLTDVFAIVAQPGEGIGDLLSTSSAGTTPPSTDDTTSDADSMLENTLAADANALEFSPITIQLEDDGTGRDEFADDGIYSGEFFSDSPGHYHILFSAEGQSASSARFRRQQLQSAVVRPFPNDLFVAITEQTGDNNVTTYRLVMKPQTSNGHLLGPGWGSYFWFDPPNSDPVRPRDNMDGTYSATFTDGPVPLHFLNIAQVLDDDTTFDDLPVSLTDDNTIAEDACNGDCPGPGVLGNGWSISAAAGINDPNSTFGNFVDGSWGFDLGVQYAFNRNFALELAYGQDMFDGKTGAPDVDVGHIKLNAKGFIDIGSNRGFGSVGVGNYDFSPGSSDTGFNLGIGYQLEFTPEWDGEFKLNYHDVDVSGSSVSFYTLQFGLRYNF